MRLASIHWDGQDRIAAAAGEDALVDLNLALEAAGGRLSVRCWTSSAAVPKR